MHARPSIIGRRVRGAALVGSITLAGMLLALVTVGLLMARSDVVLFGNFRDGTAAHYLAHAAIVRGIAGLPAGYEFDALLAGPDGSPGTDDDGAPPAPTSVAGCVTRADDDDADPDPDPYVDGNGRIRLRAGCTGPRGARREVEAVVGRGAGPFVPAALYLGRLDVDASAPVILDGADHVTGDRPGMASGSGKPVPAAASPALDAPMLLPSQLTDGSGQPVMAIPTTAVDTPALASRALVLGPPLLATLPEHGFTSAFVHVGPDARAVSPTRSSGLVVVDGDLQIDAPVVVHGLVVVSGSLRVGPRGALSVRGSLWVDGGGPGPVISVAGPLTVLYSRDALLDADRLFALPRRATLLAEREVL